MIHCRTYSGRSKFTYNKINENDTYILISIVIVHSSVSRLLVVVSVASVTKPFAAITACLSWMYDVKDRYGSTTKYLIVFLENIKNDEEGDCILLLINADDDDNHG